MKRQTAIGVALIFAGVLGVAFLASDCVGGPNVTRPAVRSQSQGMTEGEEIFLYGTANARVVPRRGPSGMMGMMRNPRGGCADCHGTDGRGGRITMMMRGFDAPDIRWSTLSESSMEHDEDDEAHPAFDRESFAHAVREGVDPGGRELDPTMPRWELDDQQIDGLIEHLREL